jgi:hypothetical protein
MAAKTLYDKEINTGRGLRKKKGGKNPALGPDACFYRGLHGTPVTRRSTRSQVALGDENEGQA